MLYEPARHEPLQHREWDDQAAVRMIERIVRDAEERFSPDSHWPMHPLDADDGRMDPVFNLYFGASGVVWALHYLQAVGAGELGRSYRGYVETLLPLNRAWLKAEGCADVDVASFLMGDTGIVLLDYWLRPDIEKAARLEALIAGNLDNPARELMWGAPGTLLAALLLHRWTREPRWAELYVLTARRLWSQLRWSPEYRCSYWSQELYGHHLASLGGVHGIAQTEAHARQYGRMRYSLWTGDLGFAVYLRDCIRGAGTFPTLDTFFIEVT